MGKSKPQNICKNVYCDEKIGTNLSKIRCRKCSKSFSMGYKKGYYKAKRRFIKNN